MTETIGERDAAIRITLKDRVRKIRWAWAESRDYEVAHAAEDALREFALRHIADNADRFGVAAEWAQLALSTSHMDFPRECA